MNSVDALVPAETARKAEELGVTKANQGAGTLLILGILAGAFIALGAVFATTISADPALSFGISRLLGGLAFCLGLILVVLAGAELFTGNNLIVMALASKRITFGKLLRNWGIVYAGNFIGALATALLVFAAEQYNQGPGFIGLKMLSIGEAKSGLSMGPAIALGILCNALVCLAVWLCVSARSFTDKVLAIVFPITAFVAAGFEHCVANMYFVPKALFVKMWGSEEFWRKTGASAESYVNLSWENFLLNNLLPVTIGNILGGSLLVGLVYWFVYLRGVSTAQSPRP